jgi:hypothetical protein
MINQHTFDSLILTNTIVAAFCIVLLVTFTVFIIFFLIPSIRRRWIGNQEKDESTMNDISSLSRQPSFHHFTMGPSRLNPLFEPTMGTATTTQFGTLFHPHATTATLLHPTIWTSMSPTSMLSSPVPVQPSTPQTQFKSVAPPPLPAHSPLTTTVVQKSPKKR